MNATCTWIRPVMVVLACMAFLPAGASAQGLKTATLFDWNFEKPSTGYLSGRYKWSPQQIEQYQQLVDASLQKLNAYKMTPESNTGIGDYFKAAKKEFRAEASKLLTPEQAQIWKADWDADMKVIRDAKTLFNEYYAKEVEIRAQNATYAPLAALRAEYIARLDGIAGAQYSRLLFEQMALNKMVRTDGEILLLELPYQTGIEYARRMYKYNEELAMTYDEGPSRNRRIKLSLIAGQYENDAAAILGAEKARQRERIIGSGIERWYRDRLGLNDTQVEACKTLRNTLAVKTYKVRNNAELSRDEKAGRAQEIVGEMRTGMMSILTPEQYAKWEVYQQNRAAKRQSKGM